MSIYFIIFIYILNNIMNNKIDIINNDKMNFLYNKVTSIINKTFINLISNHKKLLIVYLYKLIIIFSIYIDNENFISQIVENNYQDIFSLLVLLLPYYDLNESNKISNLFELFKNKSKNVFSSYYIDHQQFFINDNSIKEYFENNLININNTLLYTNNKILSNWLNIFPYEMNNYKNSKLYKNFINKFFFKNFVNYNLNFWNNDNDTNKLISNKEFFNNYNLENEFFMLGYPTLYGTINKFLFDDVKDIKWLIYDVEDNEIIYPNIIFINNHLEISNIYNKKWDDLDEQEKNNFNMNWLKIIKLDNHKGFLSLILFYLRWEKDLDNLKKISITKDCRKILNLNLEKIDNDDNIIDIDEKMVYNNLDINKCLKENIKNINPINIYNYIYYCLQKFKYTWYGYICLNIKNEIINNKDFEDKFIQNNIIGEIDNKKIYLTIKNIYNYFKSLIHKEINGKYSIFSKYPNWNNLTFEHKEIFINRLNTNKDNNNWFNISGNLSKIYSVLFNNKQINNISKFINDKIFNSDLIVNIIFETLVYNGILTYFKYNEKLTNLNLIPDKNKNFNNWKKYILDNVNIDNCNNSYHFMNNNKLNYFEDTCEIIKNSLWYTNFGANWIAQFQLYHHFNNQRLMFITGATGAGKSTVAPFLLVYALKIINFNNNGKVFCTQPRKQPTEDNSIQISKNIGLPIEKNNGNIIIKNNNYIQFRHSTSEILDDNYHPCLRLYTDGTLYNIIKNNYLFKKNNYDTILKTNLFDIILVDEAHEHNTYMDLILTLSRNAIYINNETQLGIISATMDYDEIIYRKYFEYIDDNWKSPLNLDYLNNININKNLIDRRVHLSVPFGGMNFDVQDRKDIVNSKDISKINKKVIDILKKILSNTFQGDILIFQPGQSDIIKLVKEINAITGKNILAIPFYSKLNNDILENYVKKIDNPEIRKNIRYPKNKYTIDICLKFVKMNYYL